MLLYKLSDAQVTLRVMKLPYKPDIASFIVREFSTDLLIKSKVENPNALSDEEMDAYDAVENHTWEEDVQRFGTGWDRLAIDLENRDLKEFCFRVTITRRIKFYSEEDERIFSVTLFYEEQFTDNFQQTFDYYSEKEEWNQEVQEHFLSKVQNIAPVKIETKSHIDFVG